MLKTEIDFNLNWEVEVTLNEEGAEIWNKSIYAKTHGCRNAGHTIKEQLWVIIKLFGPKMFAHETPIRPPIKLYSEELVKPIRVEVSHFVEAMESKLKQNDDRDGWQDCPMEYLLDRLNDERIELEKAVENDHGILDEAIDVANFAMMIADRAGAMSESFPRSNNEIMKAAINQAVSNGYTRLEMWGNIVDINLSDDYCMITYQDGDGEAIPTFALIYSHDFAKAFWGEDKYCWYSDGEYMDVLNEEEYEAKKAEDNHWEELIPYWQRQLQCMVIRDDPIEYLGKFIEKEQG